jgi:hypothetical protein
VGTRQEFEAIRDGPPTGQETTDLIRQFLRGDSEGPLTDRREDEDYPRKILRAAGGE